MPITGRRPVALLPLPDLPEDPNTPVFLLKATGEVFLTYEAYSSRMTYLLSRIFQCEFSGKGGLDYFQALSSEKHESSIVRERFPAELKGRVLKSVQFQVMGRLDHLIEQVFDRYKDRYFSGERVYVDLGGDKYYARISAVFPPVAIRNLAREEFLTAKLESAKNEKGKGKESVEGDQQQDAEMSGANVEPRSPSPDGPEDFTAWSHAIGTDLKVTPEEATIRDDPEEYLYTVQLMDEDHKFEGSFMEVKSKALSRDRMSFSKSILKRYIRECVQRASYVGAPWTVKPAIARLFKITTAQSAEEAQLTEALRESKLAKRRKPLAEGEEPRPSKRARRSRAQMLAAANDPKQPRSRAPKPPRPARAPAEPKRAVKYPIEDLDLDPLSIHDGRILRRVNSEIPPLPPKPSPNRNLLVPTEAFDTFIATWNLLNVFCKPLNLSPFSLDDFSAALHHSNVAIYCSLLAEVHAALTNIIGTDTSRVYGSVGVQFLAVDHDEDGEVNEEIPAEDEQDQLDQDDDEFDQPEDAAVDDPNRVDTEFDLLIRKGISFSKRWDRSAKLKSSDNREGWLRHMIGAVCTRGGVQALPNLHRMLAHIFEGADLTPPKLFGAAAASSALAQARSNAEAGLPTVKKVDTSDPDAAYLTLPIGDKIDILSFLATLAMGSKPVRLFLEEAEIQLTEYRKQRADVNKERKALTDQKAVLTADPTKDKEKEKGKSAEPQLVNALAPPPEPEVKEENEDEKDGSSPAPAAESSQTNGHAVNGTKIGNGKDKKSGTSTEPASTVQSPAPSSPQAEAIADSTRATPDPSADAASPMAVVEDSIAGDHQNGEGQEDEDEEEDQLADDDELNDAKPITKLKRSEAKGRKRSPSVTSNADSTGTPVALDGHALYRHRMMIEKQAKESVHEKQLARIRRIAETGTDREKTRALNDLDHKMVALDKKDDLVEREFRKYHFVSRARPLGKDRFHCRYWWFDGVGSMELLGKGGSGIQWGTGRLFVQGPSEADMAWMTSRAPDDNKDIAARREREEVNLEGLLGLDEWGFYDEQEQFGNLQNWLNAKGVREFALKNSLQKWSGYILAGARKRMAETIVPPHKVPDPKSRRSRRVKEAEDTKQNYLLWTNKNPKY